MEPAAVISSFLSGTELKKKKKYDKNTVFTPIQKATARVSAKRQECVYFKNTTPTNIF